MQPDQKSELVMDYIQSIFKLRYKLRRMFQVKLKEAGISISFEVLEIMKQLHSHDGLNQQDLAELLFKDKSSMTYLIDNMVKAGFVSRKEDEADRRNKLIILSDKAHELLKQLEPLASHCYAVLAAEVSGQDIKASLDTIAKMNGSLDAFII
ncbi:MarR family winged helix-turn-helix transcriptional regulator [Mucilaginibacter sp. X5P1]|uniref:MarR family winged helix-turn-helix transcriptional regulator n=1 Tax=Mucilaginibacter sp. X5P1 TaxID=2723088 RepID=UPI00161D010E|nr:MarR family transcriptional regulator [Mucilaginibacter sp. X5P1]MBB6137200.1 DNA-binding MarR family transcriptional regulator [Mucilaginibacter sp. X5P1]